MHMLERSNRAHQKNVKYIHRKTSDEDRGDLIAVTEIADADAGPEKMAIGGRASSAAGGDYHPSTCSERHREGDPSVSAE